MEDINDVCINMEKWSKEITKGSAFPRQNNPSSHGWKLLLLTTKLDKTMKHIQAHLKPAKETHLIRQNIHHLKIKEKLLRVSSHTRKSSVPKKIEIGPILEDLQALNLESQKLRDKQECLEMTKTALNIISERRKEEISQFLHFYEDLQTMVKLPLTTKASANKTKPVIILQRSINEITTELKTMRFRLIQSYLHKDPDLHERKLEIWSMVETLIANSSAELVITAVANLAQIQADRVEIAVKKIRSEENNKRENSFNMDEEIEKGVNDLLILMCAKHVTARVCAHKQQYTAKCAEGAVTVMKSNAMDFFKKRSSDELYLKAAEDLMNIKLDIAGMRAALLKMDDIRETLGGRIQLAKMTERKLVDDYKKITDFDEQVHTALFHIKGLEMNQWQSDEKIKQELDHIYHLVSTATNEMSLPTPFNFMQEELTFCIQNIRNRVKICTSNCTMGPSLIELNDKQLRNVTNLCSYNTTWDNLLCIYLQKKHTSRHLKRQISRDKMDCDAMISSLQSPTCSMKHAKDLFKKCVRNDEKFTAEVTPVLESCCERLTSNHEKVYQLLTLVEEWWNQPCQRINL